MNSSPETVIVSGDKSTLIMRPVSGEYYTSRIYQTVEVEEKGKMRKVPTVFLIKPNQVRYWTRSVALRDADEVAFDIMQWAEFEDVKREIVLDVQR
jgi:hypothetical protein